MSRLAIGTAQFGLPYGVANRSGQLTPSEGAEVLSRARAAGVDTLDTAIAYGTSEARLGALGVDGWRVVTKIPRVPAGTPDVAAWVRTSIRGSQERLGQSRLTGVLLHRPQDLMETWGRELTATLLGLRKEGVIEKVGVSVYGPDELEQLRPLLPFDLVQAPYNLVDQRLATSGWLERLRDSGVEVHVRSAFLQGVLLMAPEARPAYFARWASLWEVWDRWLADTGTSPLAACLQFALARPEIDRVVVGVDSAEQFSQIVAASTTAVPPGSLPPMACDDPDLINPSRWSPR